MLSTYLPTYTLVVCCIQGFGIGGQNDPQSITSHHITSPPVPEKGKPMWKEKERKKKKGLIAEYDVGSIQRQPWGRGQAGLVAW